MTNPIYLGAGVGALTSLAIMWRMARMMNQPMWTLVKPTVVGALGGGIGGFIATQITGSPTMILTLGFGVLGAIGAQYFAYGIWIPQLFGR